MPRSPRLLTTGFLVSGVVLLGAAPASAQVCDQYSGACVAPTQVQKVEDTPEVQHVTNERVTPATLPFTGGEVALAALVGGAALASGAALVVAGRRRPSTD